MMDDKRRAHENVRQNRVCAKSPGGGTPMQMCVIHSACSVNSHHKVRRGAGLLHSEGSQEPVQDEKDDDGAEKAAAPFPGTQTSETSAK